MHSTAQHSTAQHSTAQHSTAQLTLLNKLVKHVMQASALMALATTSMAYAQVPSSQLNTTTITTDSDDLPTVTLPAVVIVAQSEYADGPVKGLAASRVSSTTGTDESILKSTQSVSVVGQQEIETIGANNLIDALGYSAGINERATADRTSSYYISRGFMTIGTYKDGQKYQANGFDGQQEIYGLERIEAVKGADSVLSGTLPPGGVINAVSKKPFFDNAYEVNAEVGSFNRKQVSTDLNHKVNDDVAVRLVGVYRDSDTFVDFVPDDRTYIAPSLTWQLSEDTKLTLQADYQHDLTAYVYGLPADGTLRPAANGKKIARDFNQGVKGFNKYDNKRYTLGYNLRHQINPNLEVRNNLSYMKADRDFPSASYDELVNGSNTTYTRSAQKRHDKSKQLTANLSAVYEWDMNKNIHNVSLFGIDYAKQNHSTERYNGTASSIDFFNPDHSKDMVGDKFTPFAWSHIQEAAQTGVFVQNQATVNDKWVGVLGLRHDKASLEKRAFFNPSQKQEGDYNATTGRVGVAYLMDNGIAPYAGINQSFEVQLGTDRNGDLFKPTRGIQYEAGVRYQPQGSDTLLTGSVYRIDQTNVLVADPNNKAGERFRAQLGEVRSQGIELEAKTAVNDNLNLIAAYAYTDARTIKSSPSTPQLEGKRTDNVPYNKFSLWGDYRFADFGLPQLKVGAGVRYIGSTLGQRGKADLPSYTLVDAMANYKVNDNWLLSLNVKNLLDKEYVTCTYDCFYGEPRNIVGKVTYKW
ncbi:TonB-dependent siderophore receptor [Psychrobacter sp. I-STPA6b]|uniref:TonB-dependent siderophore receptor n=1 Tax=Psychrobacter sp. I-STPA6b TaxID=2585718 RepID=UPI001D0C2028|nr:TonB-dependent siderophore receptor [Psychrobacter sp. I-STPA6b]